MSESHLKRLVYFVQKDLKWKSEAVFYGLCSAIGRNKDCEIWGVLTTNEAQSGCDEEHSWAELQPDVT